MHRYRKLPVTIDAFQLPALEDDNLEPFHEWAERVSFDCYSSERDGCLSIATLEGTMLAEPGDWIIKGVAGEFYPCKDEVFRATYEPVSEDEASLPATQSALQAQATRYIGSWDALDPIEGQAPPDYPCAVLAMDSEQLAAVDQVSLGTINDVLRVAGNACRQILAEPVAEVIDGPRVQLTYRKQGATEDEADLAAARAALQEAETEGTVSWEQVRAEAGLDHRPLVGRALARIREDVGEGRGRGRLVVTMPPRSGKTTVLAQYAKELLRAAPSLRIGYASYSQRHAEGVVALVSMASLASGSFVVPGVFSTNAGGGFRGFGVGSIPQGYGFDVLLLDDLFKNQEEAADPEARERVWEWFKHHLYTRLMSGARMLAVGSAWNEDDLLARLISLAWPHLNLMESAS